MTKSLVTKEDVLNCMVKNSEDNICSLNQSQIAKKLGYVASNATGFTKILKELQDTNTIKYLRRGKWAIMKNEKSTDTNNIDTANNENTPNNNLIKFTDVTENIFEHIGRDIYVPVSKIKRYFGLKDSWIYTFLKNNEDTLEIILQHNEKANKDLKYLSVKSARQVVESIYNKYGNKIDIQKYYTLQNQIERKLRGEIIINNALEAKKEREKEASIEKSIQDSNQKTENETVEEIKNDVGNVSDTSATIETVSTKNDSIKNTDNIQNIESTNNEVSKESMVPNLLSFPSIPTVPKVDLNLDALINIDDTELINRFKENYTAMMVSYKEIVQQLMKYKTIADAITEKYQKLLNTVNQLNLEMEKEVNS